MLGTSGRTRTGTLLRAGDFESPMSTNSITLAYKSVFQSRRSSRLFVSRHRLPMSLFATTVPERGGL